jgi:hypothetical protein
MDWPQDPANVGKMAATRTPWHNGAACRPVKIRDVIKMLEDDGGPSSGSADRIDTSSMRPSRDSSPSQESPETSSRRELSIAS